MAVKKMAVWYMATMNDGSKLPLLVLSREELTIIIPVFLDYPMESLRYPLPFAVCLVPEDKVESIKRVEKDIKEETNVKKLFVLCQKKEQNK